MHVKKPFYIGAKKLEGGVSEPADDFVKALRYIADKNFGNGDGKVSGGSFLTILPFFKKKGEAATFIKAVEGEINSALQRDQKYNHIGFKAAKLDGGLTKQEVADFLYLYSDYCLSLAESLKNSTSVEGQKRRINHIVEAKGFAHLSNDLRRDIHNENRMFHDHIA